MSGGQSPLSFWDAFGMAKQLAEKLHISGQRLE
jgi:hypothetical protein